MTLRTRKVKERQMKRFGKQCEGCDGEDCGCCEVHLEHQADANAAVESGAIYSEEYDWSQHDFDHDPD